MLDQERSKARRKGAVVLLTVLLMVFLFAMVAFAVDIGYIAVARTEAQATADSAAMAGASKLLQQLKQAPIANGIPIQTAADIELARQEARLFASLNKVGGVNGDLQTLDIDVGYMANPYDHSSFNQASELDTSTGIGANQWPQRPYDAVRVRIYRDANHAGGSLDLFFAKVIGIKQADVSATATAMFPMGNVTPQGGSQLESKHIVRASSSTGPLACIRRGNRVVTALSPPPQAVGVLFCPVELLRENNALLDI